MINCLWLPPSNIMEDVLDSDAYDKLLQDPNTWRSQGYESPASAALDKGILTLKLLDWWVQVTLYCFSQLIGVN